MGLSFLLPTQMYFWGTSHPELGLGQSLSPPEFGNHPSTKVDSEHFWVSLQVERDLQGGIGANWFEKMEMSNSAPLGSPAKP